MGHAVIHKAGNFIGLSSADGQELGQELFQELNSQLTYTHTEHLFGAKSWGSSKNRNVSLTSRRLYDYDAQGRFVCSRGFLPLMQRLLKQYDHTHEFVDLDVGRQRDRPECYEPHWDRVLAQVNFRPRQEECIIRIATHEMGVVDAIPAFGKSFLCRVLGLLYPLARIDITTKRVPVLRNIYRDLLEVFPRVGFVGDGMRQWERITCISADSLHRSDGAADFLIGDEAHELLAENVCSKLVPYRYARRFGFTATPEGRGDGADIRLTSLFGEPIFRLSYPEGVQLGLVVPVEVYWRNVSSGHDPAQHASSSVERKKLAIWYHDFRHDRVADAAREFHDSGQTLILVENLEHALYLRQRLPDYTLVYGKGCMPSGRREHLERHGLMLPTDPIVNERVLEQYRRDFRQQKIMRAIATDVWSTGVDFPGLGVLIRADARNSDHIDFQGPGRVSRISPATGKSVGVVVDFIDQFNSIYRSRAADRRRNYAKFGWDQFLPDGTQWVPSRERYLSGR